MAGKSTRKVAGATQKGAGRQGGVTGGRSAGPSAATDHPRTTLAEQTPSSGRAGVTSWREPRVASQAAARRWGLLGECRSRVISGGGRTGGPAPGHAALPPSAFLSCAGDLARALAGHTSLYPSYIVPKLCLGCLSVRSTSSPDARSRSPSGAGNAGLRDAVRSGDAPAPAGDRICSTTSRPWPANGSKPARLARWASRPHLPATPASTHALAEQVAPWGRVVASDIDPTWMSAAGGAFEVLRHDVGIDEPPAGPFDLVHARLVLVHVPQRSTALAAMVAGAATGRLAGP